MKTLLLVWHSQTGGTEAMARAFVAGARAHADDAVRVRSVRAEDAGAEDVLQADAVVFATPENLAAISGRLKSFFDLHYYALLDRCVGRPYALMVCAGSDGRNAIAQLTRIATGLRLRPVAEPVRVCTHAQTPEAILAPKQLDEAQLAPCRDLGATLAAGLALGLY